MENKTVFRIEKPDKGHGMWYDEEGKYHGIVKEICPNGIAKDFPMPKDLTIYRNNDMVWKSSGKSIENMNEWFTKDDAVNLLNNGFKLFEIKTNEFIELEKEIIFHSSGIVSKKEIKLNTIWDI